MQTELRQTETPSLHQLLLRQVRTIYRPFVAIVARAARREAAGLVGDAAGGEDVAPLRTGPDRTAPAPRSDVGERQQFVQLRVQAAKVRASSSVCVFGFEPLVTKFTRGGRRATPRTPEAPGSPFTYETRTWLGSGVASVQLERG